MYDPVVGVELGADVEVRPMERGSVKDLDMIPPAPGTRLPATVSFLPDTE